MTGESWYGIILGMKQTATVVQRRYGSEKEAAAILRFSVKTLQKDRLFGKRFPFYRVGRKILYDLNEIEAIILAGRVDMTSGGRA